MHDTSPLMFDPAAAQAWLRQPSDTHAELTRAETLSVDEELTGRGGEGVLSTIRCVLAAGAGRSAGRRRVRATAGR